MFTSPTCYTHNHACPPLCFRNCSDSLSILNSKSLEAFFFTLWCLLCSWAQLTLVGASTKTKKKYCKYIFLSLFSWLLCWSITAVELGLQMQTQNFSLWQQQESLPRIYQDQVYSASSYNKTYRRTKTPAGKTKKHINWRLPYWAWHPHMETPYVLINTTYVFIIHSHPQSAKWHIQQHTVRHANISADTAVVTHSRTQFSWCNDPFGIEQHLFSKWRLVVGLLVIFSLTQWAHREGRILFSTYNQWPVLFQHSVPSVPLLFCHYLLYTTTHAQQKDLGGKNPLPYIQKKKKKKKT